MVNEPGYGYPTAWNADGPCDKCGKFVCLSAMSNGVVTHHECNMVVADEPKLVINYERRPKRMNPTRYRTFTPLGRREVEYISTNVSKGPPLPSTSDDEKLRTRRDDLLRMGEQGRLTESLRLELDYITDHLLGNE